ncbi:hypothetical protein GIB67_032587 [Kingdonia uniflora]|uniref:BED-type domain-containing protein n=1 Tax=Kingdonia uniflora TaxID=39325 RepID=A0A7J7LSH4_9MAGN|nr:hypothetical protein GIB67_032587 [Kingdonia uniflora]
MMEVSNPPAMKKTKRLTSAVWNDFERVKRGDIMVAICNHCTKKLSGSSTSGTSHLRNHLKRCLYRSNPEMSQQPLALQQEKKDGTNDLRNFKFVQEPDPLARSFDPERSRFDLVRMIILHEYPMGMVEHAGFRRFVGNLQPSFQIMSCNNAQADCIQIFMKEKQKVYEMLDKVPGKISLTADIWTSYNDNKYLCLTAHYIDAAWLLQKKILDFKVVAPCTSEALSEAIMKCFIDWDIDRKLFSMTTENCSINEEAMFIVRERLSQNRLLLNNGKQFDFRCERHILNLLVQDILEELREVTDKIRESVRYVRKSDEMKQKFNEIAHQVQANTEESLCLDCPAQWNSTCKMLEASVHYRYAFSHLQKCDSCYTMAPSNMEWDRVVVIINLLKPFKEVTNDLSGLKFPTSNHYFSEICYIHLQLIDWGKSMDMFIGFIAQKIKTKFDTYWSICNVNLAIAAVLDPRYKMKLVEYYYQQFYDCNAQNYIDDVVNTIKDLYNEYTSPLFSLDQVSSACDFINNGTLNGDLSSVKCEHSGSDEFNGALPCDNDEAEGDRLMGFDKFLKDNSISSDMIEELDQYLAEPPFPRIKDFDILNWWKVNSPKYPILSMMARDVLGIPMCIAVDSALTYDTGGRVLDAHRSSLSSDVLQALICTHDWFHNEL